MATAFVYLYQISFAFSILVLISLGLALIFGMMKVINLAQGEFLMLGAYVCVLGSGWGLPLWLAIPLAGVLVGLFGVVVERTVIQWLYGRVLDTLLATWGISLLMIGVITTVAGPQSYSVSSGMGRLEVAGFVMPGYSMVIIAGAVLMLVGTYLILRFTNLGLIVRGTMQNPQMASALGTNTSMIYMMTFGFGSALTGLAGALLVPLFGASPTMGGLYIGKAFIAVISGGPWPLIGSVSASGLYGTIDGVISYLFTPVLGEIVVLLVAIVMLRLLPSGITGRMRKGI
ncbi:MAG: branched-chain amino acid ABC transporter permease [Alkalilacustris sp.]